MATTLADFRLRVSSKLGLDNTNASAEQALMDTWANEAVRDLLIRTKCYMKSTTVTPNAADFDLQPGTPAALVIADIISPDSIPLERISVSEILRMRYSQTVSVTRWYALAGANLLMFYPTPAATDIFTLYYVPKPTEMSAAGNDPTTTTYGGIPTEYCKAIEYYMLWQGGDYDDDSSSQSGQTYKALYELEIKTFRKYQHLKGGRKLSNVIGGALRRPYIPPTNDIDTGSWG